MIIKREVEIKADKKAKKPISFLAYCETLPPGKKILLEALIMLPSFCWPYIRTSIARFFSLKSLKKKLITLFPSVAPSETIAQ